VNIAEILKGLPADGAAAGAGAGVMVAELPPPPGVDPVVGWAILLVVTTVARVAITLGTRYLDKRRKRDED
jgi:hypothetical protein